MLIVRMLVTAVLACTILSASAMADTAKNAMDALKRNDFSAARPHLEILAARGNGPSMVMLAEFLVTGRGGVKDPARAAKLFKSVASNEHSREMHVRGAKISLGSLYYHGIGVKKDIEQTLYWYGSAARSGDGRGASRLGAMYFHGDGVEINLIHSLKWYLVSSAQGNKKADEALKSVAAKMSAKEIKEARAHAKLEFSNLKFPTLASLQNIKPSPPIVTKGAAALSGPPVAVSAGFSEEIASFYSRPIEANDEIAKQIRAKLFQLPPPYIFELARRTFPSNKQDGVTYLWLATMRGVYDAQRCTDKTVSGGISQWHMYLRDIGAFIGKNPEISKEGKRRALDLDSQFTGDFSPAWICFHGMQAMQAAMTKTKFTDWLKPKAEWPAIKAKIRGQFQKAIQ